MVVGIGWLALQEGFEPPFAAPITFTEVEAQLGYCKLYVYSKRLLSYVQIISLSTRLSSYK